MQLCRGWVVPEPGTELSLKLPSKPGTSRRLHQESSEQIRASQPSRAPLQEPGDSRCTLEGATLTFPGFGRSCFLGDCEDFETADGELRFSHFADGGRGPLKIVLHTACWRSSANTNFRLRPIKIRFDRNHKFAN